MLRTQTGLRVLGPDDLRAVTDLAARNPVVHVFADYRARSTGLDPRRLGGEMWGYVEDGELVSACHAAANLVSVEASDRAMDAFANRATTSGRRCATIVGLETDVRRMWQRLEGFWPAPRDFRWDQPHLETDQPGPVTPDPDVRRSTRADLDALYPACVAMHMEELGISPEAAGGADGYRARVAQLVDRGWSFVRVQDGRVVFKAEIASVTPYACQVQGVYVDPERRGEGLASIGMAAVVEQALREVAPVVSLYVNEHNIPARRAYDRVGFRQTAQFATILF